MSLPVREVEDAESEKKYNLLQYKVKEHHLQEIWKQLTAEGLDPILIKGWAAAQLYPEPSERVYSDVDLVFDPLVYDRAEEIVQNMRTGLQIDLHKGLRHLDTVSFEDIYSNSVLKMCGSTNIRVPRDEDLLRILCVHWLTDGGAYRGRLDDIYHAVSNRSPDFDWDRLLGVVSPKRQRWIICAIGLAHKYMGLDLCGTPIEEKAKDLPDWLCRTVEKEWKDDLRLQPLHYFLHDKKKLWKQIKKRFPPNPVQATIELDGDFDKYPRFFYQFGNVFTRISPSASRVLPNLFSNIKRRFGSR